ncbi:hypothetical protein [Phenylobacterium sp.]|uniref:hypothetical protein n=1 Tax=Phenylobacterium sp. TaxID=1871053 RepID=UPI003783D090
MLSLPNRAAVQAALENSDLDPDLRTLIGRRARQLDAERKRPFGDDIRFVVVEGGDTPEVINDELGFAITGEEAEEPSYQSIEDHGFWFEIAYVRNGDVRTFIFVENGPATELGIHYLCLSHFASEEDRRHR